MENKSVKINREIDILDILIILAKRKWFIFWVTFVVSVGAVTYSFKLWCFNGFRSFNRRRK